MIAFEVYLNGKKLCVAGAGQFGSLSARLDWGRGPHLSLSKGFQKDFELLQLWVAGMSVRYKKKKAKELKPSFAYTHSLEWVRRNVRPSDEVTFRIVKIATGDKPRERKKILTPNDTLQSHKNYIRRAAKSLGWKIQKR